MQFRVYLAHLRQKIHLRSSIRKYYQWKASIIHHNAELAHKLVKYIHIKTVFKAVNLFIRHPTFEHIGIDSRGRLHLPGSKA